MSKKTDPIVKISDKAFNDCIKIVNNNQSYLNPKGEIKWLLVTIMPSSETIKPEPELIFFPSFFKRKDRSKGVFLSSIIPQNCDGSFFPLVNSWLPIIETTAGKAFLIALVTRKS